MENQKKYTREELEKFRARDLYDVAKKQKIKRYTIYKKNELIELILKSYENEQKEGNTIKEMTASKAPKKEETSKSSKKEEKAKRIIEKPG